MSFRAAARARPGRSIGDERGEVALSVVVGAVLFVLGIWLTFAAIGGDELDRYGTMSVPGEMTATLPQGEVEVTYRELVISGVAAEPLGDLSLRVEPVGGGERPTVEPVTEAVEVEAGDRRQVLAKIDTPKKGVYRLTASSQSASGRDTPRISIGTSPMGAVKLRLEQVFAAAKGPAGAVAALVVIWLVFGTRIRRALYKQQNQQPESHW